MLASEVRASTRSGATRKPSVMPLLVVPALTSVERRLVALIAPSLVCRRRPRPDGLVAPAVVPPAIAWLL
jgi:hypothetical protein